MERLGFHRRYMSVSGLRHEMGTWTLTLSNTSLVNCPGHFVAQISAS